MLKPAAAAGVVSVYKFVANVKEYTLLESIYGTYQIVKNNKVIAHPATAEDAWNRIAFFTGKILSESRCRRTCSPHTCSDCDRHDE